MIKKQQLPYKEVGARLGIARKSLGLTQKAFSEKTGIPYGTLSAYERGVNLPKLEAIEKFKAAGINVRFMLDNTGAPLLDKNTESAWDHQSRQTHAHPLHETVGTYHLSGSEALARDPSAYFENRKKAYDEVEAILSRINFKQAHKLLIGTMAELIDNQEITLRAAELLLVLFKDRQTKPKQ